MDSCFGKGDRTRWRPWICLSLVCLTAVAYLDTLQYGFLAYDDPVYVTANERVLSGLTWDNIRWAMISLDAGFWHPMTWISLMIDHALYGVHAGGYHATNLLLHAGSAILLFLLLAGMTGCVWRSAMVGALFALHPLRVESVAWIAERKDVLSGFFWMAAMAAYVWHARRPGWRRYVWVLAGYAMGLMSKPVVVTLPAVLLLLDIWPLGRWSPGGGRKEWFASGGRMLREKAPLIVMAIGVGLTTVVAEHRLGALPSWGAYPFTVRWENAAVSYIRYLGKMFWPFDLAVFYPHPGGWPCWQVLCALLALLLITALAVRARRAHPYLMTGWLWYLATLFPMIGVIQVGAHAMADRYTYLPLIGVFIMLVWGVAQWAQDRPKAARVLPAASLLLVLSLVLVTRNQVSVWKDTLSLFGHAVQATENNALAHHNFGYALLEAGRPEMAKAHFETASRLRPDYEAFHNSLGVALMRMQRYGEAVRAFQQALRINGRYVDAHANLAQVYVQTGELIQASKHLEAALRVEPDSVRLLTALGNVRIQQRDWEGAIAVFTKILEKDACHAGASHNIGMVYLSRGHLDSAIAYFRKALACEPRYASAHFHLAKALQRKGKHAQADRHRAEALRINPRIAALP